MNQHPGATPMFYITVEGALFVEVGGGQKTALLTARKIVTYGFKPCPDPQTTAQGTLSLPWMFSFTDSAPREYPGNTRAAAMGDLEKLGGCLLLNTPYEYSYAKGFILDTLMRARG